MLYTRCPECETTFRITESALQQARGQVRCGRCGNIFDAHASLTDRLPDPDDPAPAAPVSTAGSSGEGALRRADDAAPAAAVPPPPATTSAEPAAPAVPQARGAADGAAALDHDSDEALSLAAEIETAEAEADAEDDEPSAAGTGAPVMSANEVDAVLDRAASAPPPHWLDDAVTPAPPMPQRPWLAALAVAALVLVLQVTHHFRSALAGAPVVGGFVQGVYSVFGQRVDPNWDVTGYELVDWMAIEAPGQSAAQRNLVIRSQLRNASDRAQPYPLMHLQLLDRWEDAVGARLFEPVEYASDIAAGALMPSGATVDAELVIVDPGTDAYGFELAVCLETATGVVCDTDATFR